MRYDLTIYPVTPGGLHFSLLLSEHLSKLAVCQHLPDTHPRLWTIIAAANIGSLNPNIRNA
jgi:hypothetical protein